MLRNLFSWLVGCIVALWAVVVIVERYAGPIDVVATHGSPTGYVCPRCREVLLTDGDGPPFCWRCFRRMTDDDLLDRVIEREVAVLPSGH